MDDRDHYRDDLLHGTLTMVAALVSDDVSVTDKDIDYAVTVADRVIRQVDKYVGAVAVTQPAPAGSTVDLSGVDECE